MSSRAESQLPRSPLACILPPGLLRRVATANPDTLASALATWHLDTRLRTARAASAARTPGRAFRPVTFARVGGSPQRTIYDQQNTESQTPGKVARTEGAPPSGDKATDEAYDGFGATYNFYWQIFNRDSIDGQGLPILGLVHFGTNYDNAFWDGAGHMFFGDGDGQMLTRTTAGLDVIGHELTHGVTQHEANLDYSGQSGALNEAMSDSLGISIKQYALQQSAAQADWLIGADIVGPELKPALRSMKAPGTANPHDDQPADMDGYVDGGDVHTNSGIPNRAYYLVATTIGGNSWEAPAKIWYDSLCDPNLTSTATFSKFAAITLKQAKQTYGADSAEANAVAGAWDTVKVPIGAGQKGGATIKAKAGPAKSATKVAMKAPVKSKPKKKTA
jgi:Zn-dependent metalloprotease